MRFLRAELHTHTTHSDGRFTPQELVDLAMAEGIEVLAITDHNTSTGVDRLVESCGDVFTSGDSSLLVVKGIEWTTFWGHIVVLGGNSEIDWRTVNPRTAESKIAEADRAGDVMIIAHPRRFSGPVCKGCYYEMPFGDCVGVAGVEINSSDPKKLERGAVGAYNLWVDLLRDGKKIAAVYGRDWHGKIKYSPMYTFIGVEDFSVQAVLDGIREKRTFISSRTLQPVVKMKSGGVEFYYGDCVAGDDIEIAVDDDDLVLVGDGFECGANFCGKLDSGWYFIESRDRDFVTSPFFVRFASDQT